EPQPCRNLELESKPARSRDERLEHQDRSKRGADLNHEHHRVFSQCHGIQLDERIDNRPPDDRWIEQRPGALAARKTHRGGIGGLRHALPRFNLNDWFLQFCWHIEPSSFTALSSLNQV